jgi:hypothetical protein
MKRRMLTFGVTALVALVDWLQTSDGRAGPITAHQTGVKAEFVRLETAGITGNSHMMMLEKNSDDIISFI